MCTIIICQFNEYINKNNWGQQRSAEIYVCICGCV